MFMFYHSKYVTPPLVWWDNTCMLYFLRDKWIGYVASFYFIFTSGKVIFILK